MYWRRYGLVAALGLLTPAILALLLFPTPMSDTREALAWGHTFSLAMPKHPPMMQWIAGLTERTLGTSAVAALLVNQALSAIGLLYVLALLRRVVDDAHAFILAFLFATSIYFIAAPLVFALNADVLQIASWAAIIYHAVRAAESNRWSHWVALALWSAAAVYTKYTVAILFMSLALASLTVAEFRAVWANPRLYLSMLLAALFITPHVVELTRSAAAIEHAEGVLRLGTSWSERFRALREVLLGPVLYLLPGWLMIVIGLLFGHWRLGSDGTASTAIRQFLRNACILAWVLLAILTVVLGLDYESRYDGPFLILLVLALAPFVRMAEGHAAIIEGRMPKIILITLGGIVLVSFIVYGLFTGHDYMQEPTGEAMAQVRQDWDRAYPCGPAYVLGDPWSANGLPLRERRGAIGIHLPVIREAPWFTEERLRQEGAIVVYRDEIAENEVARFLPGVQPAEIKSVTLPYLRTWAHRTMTYKYFFIAPQACGAS